MELILNNIQFERILVIINLVRDYNLFRHRNHDGKDVFILACITRDVRLASYLYVNFKDFLSFEPDNDGHDALYYYMQEFRRNMLPIGFLSKEHQVFIEQMIKDNLLLPEQESMVLSIQHRVPPKYIEYESSSEDEDLAPNYQLFMLEEGEINAEIHNQNNLLQNKNVPMIKNHEEVCIDVTPQDNSLGPPKDNSLGARFNRYKKRFSNWIG